ncbi:c-type cytochrome [Dermatobacter hominis]|uniref:c-type cytochrome n=1 Tax=Dermatobacter hominis TaxID=2884263 RepID=UPI001D10B1EC|nr:c-type cytochrome [Dermatobacter hominis]UDY33982.1 c-type cytochrome [Dermatobacter hominis]
MIVATSTQRAFGFVILAIVAIGFVVWFFANLRAGQKEVGSEIELAPNRKQYLSDEELEGKKLNMALFSALGLLAVIAVALPLYWLAEPGRQEGAVEMYSELFIERGLTLYEEGAQCVTCHGGAGVGGVTTFIINDQNGQFVGQVSWNAPALNNVLYRYNEDQVRYVLNYGRPGTPMAAWGTPGGGPLTTQQVDDLIAYLWSVQLKPKELRTQVDDFVKSIDPGLYDRMVEVRKSNQDVVPNGDVEAVNANRLSRADELRLGEILFNNQSLAQGSYSCARCHVAGAPYGQAWQPFLRLQYGSFGPDLTGVENEATEQQHFNLVWNGMDEGKLYFSRKQGNPQMPGFGVNRNTGKEAEGVPDFGPEGLLTPEEVWAIVTYERNLSNDSTVKSPLAGTIESPTFVDVPRDEAGSN